MIKYDIDYADVVTSHICNMHCKYCVDKFIHSSTNIVKLEDLEKFLKMLRNYTDKKLEILLLGG